VTIRFEELFAKRLSRIKPGLARVQEANEQLGWISVRTPSIMIAGTNGKGTTSAFLWRLLSLAGLRCGLFTSPHLLSFAERIQMSGHPVTESDLERAIPGLVSRVDAGLWAELSFFEASLLLGFRVWEGRGSQVNVLEAGLGGRLDATNIANPDLCVITSIGIDHSDYLGGTVDKIAFEKASIIRPGKPAVAGFEVRNPGDADAMRVIEAVAASRSAPFLRLGRDFGIANTPTGVNFWFDPGRRLSGQPFRLEAPLPSFFDGAPPYLIENFCAAAAATICWLRGKAGNAGQPFDGPRKITALFEAFSAPGGPWSPVLCGRFHPVRVPDGARDREFLFDVCHNPHGARRFVEALDRAFGEGATLPGIVSILNDKDIGGILDVLSGKLQPVVLFRISNDRGLKPDSIPVPYRDLPLAGDFTEATRIMAAMPESASEPMPWVVCGSVMAVGEALGVVTGTDTGTTWRQSQTPRGPREAALAAALELCHRVRDRDPSSIRLAGPDGPDPAAGARPV